MGVNTWGTTYTLTDRTGATVATSSNPNRRRWTIVAGDQTYEFHRRAWWRQHYELVAGGQAVGFIQRPSLRAEATAQLPAMPLAIQVFALALALTTWDAIALLVWPF